MRSLAVIAVVMSGLAAPALSAQTRVSLHRGVGQYDLSGVDEGTVTAVRLTSDFSRHFSADVGVSFVELEQAFGETTLYQPEVQLQARLPFGRFSPHAGVGVGMAIDVPGDDNPLGVETDRDFTMHAGLGLRVDVTRRLGVLVDGRIRNIGDPWIATGTDGTIGLSYRF